jgi:hypothetical protein
MNKLPKVDEANIQSATSHTKGTRVYGEEAIARRIVPRTCQDYDVRMAEVEEEYTDCFILRAFVRFPSKSLPTKFPYRELAIAEVMAQFAKEVDYKLVTMHQIETNLSREGKWSIMRMLYPAIKALHRRRFQQTLLFDIHTDVLACAAQVQQRPPLLRSLHLAEGRHTELSTCACLLTQHWIPALRDVLEPVQAIFSREHPDVFRITSAYSPASAVGWPEAYSPQFNQALEDAYASVDSACQSRLQTLPPNMQKEIASKITKALKAYSDGVMNNWDE